MADRKLYYRFVCSASLLKSVDLVAAARKAMERSYSPYSHLRVGAALLMEDGKVFTGCNVENAAFAATICAERTAITKAVSEGSRSIKKVVVASDAEEPLLPCGDCLQTMSEFAMDGKVQIVCVGKGGEKSVHRLGRLFPSGSKVHKTIRTVTG